MSMVGPASRTVVGGVSASRTTPVMKHPGALYDLDWQLAGCVSVSVNDRVPYRIHRYLDAAELLSDLRCFRALCGDTCCRARSSDRCAPTEIIPSPMLALPSRGPGGRRRSRRAERTDRIVQRQCPAGGSGTATFEPATDAASKWLGFHCLQVAAGVFGQERRVGRVLCEDFAELPFGGRRPPAAPVGWPDVTVTVDTAIRSVTLRRGDGRQRTVVDHGVAGLHVLAEGEAAARIPFRPRPRPFGASCRAGEPWPIGNAPAMGRDKIHAALRDVVADGYGRAVAVAYRGELIGESYAAGYTRDTRHNGWSVTKSIAGTLLARMVHEGLLTLDAPLAISAWREGDSRRAITVDDVLRMRSGLDCPVGARPWARGDKHWSVYGGTSDVDEHVTSLECVAPPGSRYLYQNSDPHLATLVTRTAASQLGIAEADVPWELLFRPLGMDSPLLASDPAGHHLLFGVCMATALDWLRFGQLILDDGVWQGRRLLPTGWLDYITTPALTGTPSNYGSGLFWRGHDFYGGPRGPIPPRTALAVGCLGQRLLIIPEHNLVIVRLGHGENEPLLTRTIATIINTVQSRNG